MILGNSILDLLLGYYRAVRMIASGSPRVLSLGYTCTPEVCKIMAFMAVIMG